MSKKINNNLSSILKSTATDKMHALEVITPVLLDGNYNGLENVPTPRWTEMISNAQFKNDRD